MKTWSRIAGAFFMVFLFFVVYLNLELWHLKDESIPQDKITEINRAYEKLMQGVQSNTLETEDIKIQEVEQSKIDLSLYMNHAKERMVVLPSKEDGMLYVFSYTMTRIPMRTIWIIDAFLFLILLFLGVFILYVYMQILRPFQKFEYIAQAMRKRDFSYELPRQRNQFFGKFIWAVDVMREELRQHEEKEIKLMKENKLMIASISHDIKTPLSTIRLYSDALEQNLYPSTIIQQRINENCDKIDTFVKEIQQTNRKHLFNFDVSLQEVYTYDIQEILKHEKERIQLRRIHYTQTNFHDVIIRCDIHRVREVIGNVIDNAMKYGDGNWIHVDLYEEEHHLIIKIENSGSGVNETDRNAIFQSFYRGSNVQNEKGNGLGLYICKQLMRKMDGDIFMSQKEGSVAFHIVLEML